MQEENERFQEKLKKKEEKISELEQELTESTIKVKRLALSQNRSSGVFESFSDDKLKEKNDELELKLLDQEEKYMEQIDKLNEEIKNLKLILNSKEGSGIYNYFYFFKILMLFIRNK